MFQGTQYWKKKFKFSIPCYRCCCCCCRRMHSKPATKVWKPYITVRIILRPLIRAIALTAVYARACSRRKFFCLVNAQKSYFSCFMFSQCRKLGIGFNSPSFFNKSLFSLSLHHSFSSSFFFLFLTPKAANLKFEVYWGLWTFNIWFLFR